MPSLKKFLNSVAAFAFMALLTCFPAANAAPTQKPVAEIFQPTTRNQLVMEIEAAIAQAQAKEGVIPQSAADEISRTASIDYAPLDDIAAEYDIVRHRMVALLNVWRRSLSAEAGDYLHFGVTTVDIYDTVKILQIQQSITLLIEEMRLLEEALLALATEHRATPMIGRTLGQHALPITFGKKVSVWAAANRRNITRLQEVNARIEQMGVLKGAVGTHLGLGRNAIKVEERVSKSLGLLKPDPTDWHGMRDVFAEYAQTLALISKTNSAIGEEVFRLQMTDIAELHERRLSTAVGSSTMPHKRNPSKSEALVHHGRVIPRLAEVLLDDVANAFERDNTSRANAIIEEISIDAARMIKDTRQLIERLEIHEETMRRNLDRTDGMIMAQRIMLYLAEKMSREEAEKRVREAAEISIGQNISFREALLQDPVIAPHLATSLDALLNPETYLGLSTEQVDRTVAHIRKLRRKD